jgi:mono/diheme cytochrome c family protein
MIASSPEASMQIHHSTLTTRLSSLALVALAVVGVAAQGPPAPPAQPPADPPGSDFLPRPPVVRQAPEVQQQLFLLPPGYKAELVLADPAIRGPVAINFDANGRMYVVEMWSYMRDADGSNSREPNSRISRWEDTNGDGTYDRSTVFADGLVMPRTAFPLEDGAILVLETDNRELRKFVDTNGDGVADRKDPFFSGFGRVTNMEWQPGGITWALDNWMYSTYNPFRIRLMPDGRVVREETDVNGGQWGANQDNYGKMWFVDGGTGLGPVNFQAPIVYGAFNVPDNFEPDFQEVWPAPGGIADMQGGMNAVRLPDGTLNRMTSAAGPEIFRGHRLPADLVGDLFLTEPVGRIVRRAKVVVTDGLTQLQNAHPKSEFLRSTDPLFRPVNIANGPDGTLYVVDMYTGIIQDAQFVGPNSYLRRKVQQYGLDKQHSMGRIWRITHESQTPDRTPPAMYQAASSTLVSHLAHPNGWWRDTAQKLLVLRQDKSVVPALKTIVQNTAAGTLGRMHALWVLEGLGGLDATLLRGAMKDPDPQIRIQAIRASETLYKATPGDKSFANDYRALTKDADPNVVIQAMLTANLLRVPQAADLVRSLRDTHGARGVKEIASQVLQPQAARGQPASNDAGAGYLNLTPADRKTLLAGETIYRELCFSCHGNDGTGMRLGGQASGPLLAPALAGSARVIGHRDYVIKVLLHGLSGPIDGQEFNGGAVMVPMGANTDEWIADVANYIRNAFGNSARPLITAEQVAGVRRATRRNATWTMAALEPTVPVLVPAGAEWKVSASHNEAAAVNALGTTPGARWDTGASQAPGQWFQIELPQPITIAEVQIDSAALTGVARAGQGGFGGLGAAPAPPAPRAGGAGGRAGGATGRGGGGGRGRGAALPPADGPVAFRVQTSTDGVTWSAPVAEGAGESPATIITLSRPTTTRFVRITQTGTARAGEFWAIQQLRVYQLPSSR